MKLLLVLVAAFAMVGSGVPMAAAQTLGTPVPGCKNECTPAEVNDNKIKTGEDPVRTILYGHFQDILNRAPLNTQLPGQEEGDLNQGYLMPVVSTKTGTDADLHFENNWFYMFSSAGFVEIQDGVWRTHQEPGLAEPVQLKGDTINLYFYLSAYTLPGASSSSSPTGKTMLSVMPQIGVYARMETGRHPFAPQSVLLAEGDTGAGDASGVVPNGGGRVTIVSTPGAEDIYEFMVPMAIKQAVIPDVNSAPGFIVSINPHQVKGKDDSAIQGYQLMQADWRVRVGPKTPPRLVMDVANPMTTKAASLSLFNDAMFIRWSFLSPWGSYDADDRSISVQVTGPTSVDAKQLKLVIIKRSVDHDGHFKPINATWRFDYQKAGLADGDYKVTMSILNLQGTYRLVQELDFKIVNGQPADLKSVGGAPPAEPEVAAKKSSGGLPGFEAVALLGAVAAALGVALRRRP